MFAFDNSLIMITWPFEYVFVTIKALLNVPFSTQLKVDIANKQKKKERKRKHVRTRSVGSLIYVLLLMQRNIPFCCFVIRYNLFLNLHIFKKVVILLLYFVAIYLLMIKC